MQNEPTGTTSDLDSIEEEALEPDLRICDPHHHLWDYPGSRYLLDELLADTRAHRIEKTVFVRNGAIERVEYDSNYNIYWGQTRHLRSSSTASRR